MKRLFFRLSLFSALFLGTVLAAGPWMTLSPSVAGQDVPVRISGLLEKESLSFLLVRPDESKIPLESMADELGVSSFFIHGLHVRQAGSYELIMRRGQSSHIVTEQFFVAPAFVSAYQSTQVVDIPSLAADGEQVARIRVTAKDAHGNIITNVPVKAFSSRVEDLVVAAPQTNAQGEVVVKVSSRTPGVSSISILIGDVLLSKRTELVFHLADTTMSNVGAGIGKYLQTSLFEDPDEPTEVAYFSLEDLGAEVVSGKNLTVRVGAKDKNGDVITDYTGTVRFSSSDDRAVLPNDYAFMGEDQGWHTFYLSVMFQTPGMQTLGVLDLDDFRISGERNVTVSDGSGVVSVPDALPELTIDIPMNGATFSTSRITLSGKSVGCSVVRLADGPIELIGELPVDASGTYVYQTPGLADGMHLFQATCVENPTITSNVVQITIDRSPPQVMSAEFSPSGVIAPGAEVTLNIGASDELSAVSCVFLGQVYELQQKDSKNFSVVLRAPLASGEYPVEVTLADLLGNEMTEPNAGVVVVAVKKEISIEFVPGGDLAPGAEVTMNITTEKEMASMQYSLLGQVRELTRKDSTNLITEGENFTGTDITYFSGTFIAPMAEGEYVADFTGIDLLGNNVSNPSPKKFFVTNDGAGANVAPLPASNVQTTPGENQVTVLWSPSIDDTGIKNYKINFGFCGEVLAGENITPDARTQWYVDGLESCVEQCFQVTPIDVLGVEGVGSAIVSGTPICEEEIHSAPPKTGGETSWWFAIFSLIAGIGAVLLLRRNA